MRAAGRLLGIFAFALASASPAMAILPSAPQETAPATAEPAQPLETERDAGADDRIAARLREIFAEIPSLAAVEVSVSEGVVTLSGTAPDEAAITRAENIAARFDIATVENTIERDVSVGSSVGAIETLGERFTGFAKMLPLIGVAVLVALAIGAIGYLIAGFGRFWRKVTPNPFLAELVASAIRFVFVVVGLVIALDMLGAGALLGAVLGGAGVIGIALGFAMRDTIENYVASLMLSLRQPFRANDLVLIGDLEGRIIRLTSRATIMMTLDGNHLRIPNSTVFKAVILNYTTNPQRRFDFELGIDADDDPNAARHLGRETLKSLGFVLSDPAPEARVTNVGDSNIVIQFLGWIDQTQADWYKARSRSIAAVKSALEAAGFGLPEPIYRLRFDERTMPLPFENIEGKAQLAKPKKPAAAAEPPAEAHDISPEDEITKMVEAERAAEPVENDLLDPDRPTE